MKREQTLEQTQDRVINQVLLLICAVGAVIVMLTMVKVSIYGLGRTAIVHMSVLLFMITLALFRKRLDGKLKITLILLALSVDITWSIYVGGFISSAKVLLAVIPVYISFIFSYRTSVISLLVIIVAYGIMGCLFITGTIVSSIDLAPYSLRPTSWLIDCAIILFSSSGLLYIGRAYNQSMLENSAVIESQVTEITDREKKYEELFQSSNDAILLFQNQIFVDCNKKATELFACDRDDLIGANPVRFSPEFQPDGQSSDAKALDLLQKTYNGEPQVFEWEHSKLNGEPFDALISLKLVRLQEVNYVQAVIRDITRQKTIENELIDHRDHLEQLVEERTVKLEQINNELSCSNRELQATLDELRKTQTQLIESEKMASVGILTAGVSHEINNPLNFILGGLHKLKDTYENKAEYKSDELELKRKESVEVIDEGVSRIKGIVKSLNHFNRANDSIMQPCNVPVILDNCANILNHELKGVHLKKSYSDDLVVILGNEGKLHQVFLNLIHNARQSIAEGGTIELVTGYDPTHEMGVITVSDTGKGIPQSQLSKVFDPFYTTKPPGEGVGLGLFIVYQIVKELNGKIDIQSTEEVGTRITTSFPMV